MQVRDRIKELRRVPASQLRPNPRNWRKHPAAQQEALRGVLSEIGYAGALLARELADGSLELIDGHLRAETTPDVAVPVLVLDVSAAEADKLLATYDPLTALATPDADLLASLLGDVETGSAAVQAMLDDLLATPVASDALAGTLDDAATDRGEHAAPADADIDHFNNNNSDHGRDGDRRENSSLELFHVVVECLSEAQQQAVFDQLVGQGLRCRLLVL